MPMANEFPLESSCTLMNTEYLELRFNGSYGVTAAKIGASGDTSVESIVWLSLLSPPGKTGQVQGKGEREFSQPDTRAFAPSKLFKSQ